MHSTRVLEDGANTSHSHNLTGNSLKGQDEVGIIDSEDTARVLTAVVINHLHQQVVESNQDTLGTDNTVARIIDI
jgi:hypothetical protein